MKTTLQTLIVSSFLASLVVAGLTACPSFAEENGIDFWNIGSYQQQIDACQQERTRMQIENEVTYRRIELKEEIVKDLLGDRIGFEEAARRFEHANQTLLSNKAYHTCYPGKTSLERASLQLLAFLRAGRGEQASMLADRIECNFSYSCG